MGKSAFVKQNFENFYKMQKFMYFVGGNVFFVIKAKKMLALLVVLIVFSVMFFANAYKTEYVSSDSVTKFTVVVDAGHGGVDGGSIGKTTHVKESDLNLQYAKKLKEYLTNAGIKVVMTRTTSDGLYDTGSKNLKKSDMQKRKHIIEKSNPNCVVSIHMNSFRLASSKGAQTFYKKGSVLGKNLADCIQKQFISALPHAKKTTLSGDYFMVNCTDTPSVIVECGFISNPEEEKLLQQENYKNNVCYLIMCGVLEYLNSK